MRETHPGGNTIEYAYDDFDGHYRTVIDNGRQTTYAYDALGRERERIDGRGVVFLTNYDYLGRVTSMTAGNETTTYTYGQKAMDMNYLNNGSLYCRKFYWGEYEEIHFYSNSETVRTYWVEAPDGLAGMFWTSTSDYYTVVHPNVAMTDHLGSLTGLYDYDGNKVFDASYDAWGKRTLSPNSFTFIARGYTGHEHLDELGMINMNGRMYDPRQGRFLSPDPFVQAPSNPQNYNRYSYCLNNPLKYTDPTGEVFWEAVIIGAAVFGTGNTIAHGIRGDIDGWGDGLKYFAQGALAGAALGATWYLAPSIPVVGNAVQTYMTYSFQCKIGMTAVSAVSGLGKGIFTGDWNGLWNAGKIFLGNFYIDENAGFWEGVWQGYSKQSWESIQTGLGHTIAQFCNRIGLVKSVSYAYGATVTESKNSDWGAFTLGSFIYGQSGIEPIPKNSLFQHEYGHYLQSRAHGPGFIIDGFKSIKSALFDTYSMDSDVEIDANRRALWYFYKNVTGFATVDEEGFLQSDPWEWEDNPLEKRLIGGNHNHKYKY